VSITVHIPGPLRDFSQQRGEVQLSGSPATLLEALQLLWAAYPGLRDRLLTEEGHLREHINIFVGNESIRYTGGLATPLAPKSTISIIPAISGGIECGGLVDPEPRRAAPLPA
jgi:molybdopterin converting factor small subunit